MREFFIFNCEAITINLRKKRKVLDQLLVSWVLHMYSYVTFSYIKHNRNLLTVFHPPPQDSQGAPWHLDKWSENRAPLQRSTQDTKDLTVQHLYLLRTQHLMDCSLEGQPREVGLEKSPQNLTPTRGKETSLGHGKERAKAELHMQEAMWEWRAANSARLGQYRVLMELWFVTETCQNGTCHQRLHISATAKAHVKTTKALRRTWTS